MAESAASCSHCGKQDVVLKKCSVCKQASYCGTECQKAGWKRHKKTCTAPLPLTVVAGKLNAAHASGDWKTVLEHAGRMEEMMAHRTEAYCEAVLANFSHALRLGWNSTGSQDHARSFVALEERRIPILGNLQRFRDQGNSMCTLAIFFSVLHRGDVSPQSCVYFERARKVGEAHGFFTVECKACTGLGRAAMREGRHEEGVELLRNELVAARLNEMDDPKFELDSLDALIDALFATDAVDEAEPLVQRFREAAKEQSELEGVLGFAAFDCLYWTATLHEARGRPQEAAGAVRALLALMREHDSEVQKWTEGLKEILGQARLLLKVLDPEVGEAGLRLAVDVAIANLRKMA